MPAKIFIGNLTSDTKSGDLRPLFEQYGCVEECDVLRNFGFVHMSNDDEASAAITELTGTLVKGQRINVEKSTGGPNTRGPGRMGGRGRGGMRGRGGRDRGGGPLRHDPYPPPRPLPYARDPYPYDYPYDRPYPGERLPPYPDERRLPYDREDRLPPPRDLYDRYPPSRYPPPERYPYDRYPPRPDPYERPPPDYYSRYRAYDGFDDPIRRPPLDRAPVDDRPLPPPPVATRPPMPSQRVREAANGYEERPLDPSLPAAGADSYSSSYSSYYERFYKATPAEGDRMAGAAPPAGRMGAMAAPTQTARPVPAAGRMAPTGMGAAQQPRKDQQSLLQTGPIYF